MRFLFSILLINWAVFLVGQTPEITLAKGLIIKQSCRVKLDEYHLQGAADLDHPAILIKGENLEIDFQGAQLIGNDDYKNPDKFSGLGIRVEGKKITIRNVVVKGFKVGILAANSYDFQLSDSDFSYNWRPRLLSTREKENEADWLSYHHNEKDEWLRYGAGIYLKNCVHATVKNCKANDSQNALLMTNCHDGLFYNNDFRFNSGIGIGLYRSTNNRVMHNRLNWNVRGSSNGFYQRGQDSAGILVYEQSNKNVFAFNSATHCGDGFFLWAGQSTMDTGIGGCNDNLVYANDFSFAPANGIEATFSRNLFFANLMDGCTYGIWAGYSFNSKFIRNVANNCKYGIAIEHGQKNDIARNGFQNDSIGVKIWAKPEEPSDWNYPKKRDTKSTDYEIEANSFDGVETAISVNDSKKIKLFYSSNSFSGCKQILTAKTAADSSQFQFLKRPDGEEPPYKIGEADNLTVAPLPDAMDAKSGLESRRQRHWIWMTDWGPYDFKGPICRLSKINGSTYEFWLLAPVKGLWQVKSFKGIGRLNMVGGFPGKISAEIKPGATEIFLDIEAVMDEETTDPFGKKMPARQPFHFEFKRIEKEGLEVK